MGLWIAAANVSAASQLTRLRAMQALSNAAASAAAPSERDAETERGFVAYTGSVVPSLFRW